MTIHLELWQARETDPETSKAAARQSKFRWHSDCDRLLEEFRRAGAAGLTDYEAAVRCGLAASGFWKRCSDLRAARRIVPTGETRLGPAGRAQMVSRYSEERE